MNFLFFFHGFIGLGVDIWPFICDVKAKIQKKEGIPWHQQILIIDGKILEDGKTLADHHILIGSRLELVVSLGGP